MEQFGNRNEVKEKSVYLVHLDNTRIVILASVLVGIVALSFLIGMKMKENHSDDFFMNPQTQTGSFSDEFSSTDNEDLDKLINEGSSLDDLAELNSKLGKESDDTKTMELTASDLEKTDTGKTESAVSKPEPEIKTVAKTESKPASSKPKDKPKPVAKKVKPATKVVAVSAPVTKPKPSDDKYSSVPKGFAIQIASFDNESKAVNESSRIRGMSYSTYIDKAFVNGKYFYRVKIGPFLNKHDAFATLNKIHTTTVYSDSFVIHEK